MCLLQLTWGQRGELQPDQVVLSSSYGAGDYFLMQSILGGKLINACLLHFVADTLLFKASKISRANQSNWPPAWQKHCYRKTLFYRLPMCYQWLKHAKLFNPRPACNANHRNMNSWIYSKLLPWKWADSIKKNLALCVSRAKRRVRNAR